MQKPLSLAARIDTHVHGAPDEIPRLLTNVEITRQARAAHVRGVALKSHAFESVTESNEINAGRRRPIAFGVWVINRAFTSAILRETRNILKAGARIICLPTTAAANHRRVMKQSGGISILQNGKLLPEVKSILRLMAQARVTLATGHIGRDELHAVLEEAWKVRVPTVLVTHPEYRMGNLSRIDQVAIRDAYPNVLFERTCYSILKIDPARRSPSRLSVDKVKWQELLENILFVGAERSILSSDLGQPFNPPPIPGFAEFLGRLYNSGISREQLDWMTIANPRRAVGLFEEYLTAAAKLEQAQAGASRKAWRAPLVGLADAADPLFNDLKKHIGPHHLHPEEILPGARSVISIFVPFAKQLIDSNRKNKTPSPEWCLAYTETNQLLDCLTERLGALIDSMGFTWTRHSASHHLSHNHNPKTSVREMTSAWSQRHVAYIAGLGTFGRNHLLITDKGCAGRFSSILTAMPLQATTRPAEYCLQKRGHACEKCVAACPPRALEENRIDRKKCWEYLVAQNAISRKHDLPIVNVCGKCASNGPCRMKKPIR